MQQNNKIARHQPEDEASERQFYLLYDMLELNKAGTGLIQLPGNENPQHLTDSKKRQVILNIYLE